MFDDVGYVVEVDKVGAADLRINTYDAQARKKKEKGKEKRQNSVYDSNMCTSKDRNMEYLLFNPPLVAKESDPSFVTDLFTPMFLLVINKINTYPLLTPPNHEAA
jgi:hypothetical protein